MKSIAPISIVIANYNNAAFLNDLFLSIDDNTFLPQEVIVVDDCSTDNSVDIIIAFAHKIPYLRHECLKKNVGVANARNKGIALASGQYIAVVDADDKLAANKIELQWNYVKNNKVDVLGSNCTYFDTQTGVSIGKSNFPLNHAAIVAAMKNGENGILNGTVLAKAALLKQHQYKQDAVWAEDYELFARLCQHDAVFAALPQALMQVRIHTQSATSNLAWDTIFKIYKFRSQYFGIPFNGFKAKIYFYHLSCYRRYLITAGPVKWWWLLLAAMLHPVKVLRKIGA